MLRHANFVHLHLHTQYSLLDGACRIPELINLASEFLMPALSITDHGNMFGAIEFYLKAMEKGIKPIIGCEVYMAPTSRFEKSSHGIEEASYHFTLLVKNEEGYKNLLKLVTASYLEGFYYRPRIDKEILAQNSRGLVGLSGCLKSEISRLIINDKINEAKRALEEFRSIFDKDDFYLEIQDQRLPEQQKLNRLLISLSRELHIPLVATNDVHYLSKETAPAHEVLLCIQTQTNLGDPHRMRFGSNEFYFKSPQEMQLLFSETPEAIDNTIRIAERCNLELEFNKLHLPQFSPPVGKSKFEYLKELCERGLRQRYKQSTDEIKKRLEYELNIIRDSGYTSYFLIVWDFVHFAKNNAIPVGPGRGSAAGSLVSYLLGITDIDPLKYGLLFERFLNPERISPPDIDIDFCYERRPEVIEYVIKKYGKDNVAQIITFGTMMARAVVRDVGRAMDISYSDVDKIAKLIPPEPNMTLKEALEIEPQLNNLYKNDPQITQLIDTSLALEGLARHASTHAAGVVISEKPLTEYLPLFKTTDNQITTGYAMDSLEKIGLLKMDFLGLRTLTVIDQTLKIIRRTRGKSININEIPLNDKKTFKLLAEAQTVGVFQLESWGMRELLRRMKPERFEDIIAILALYRPGPIGSGLVDDFIKRKRNKVKINYDHKSLEPILKETYGIILYQEQVMRIASEIGGFSLSEADMLRRAMSKKNPGVMERARQSFLKGALKKGIEVSIANKIFDQIEYFARYGFNKSHSSAYALISYRTAYLKANFPTEFMTALLTSEKDNTDKLVTYINEANRMGIKILAPDVNESFAKFTYISGDKIRFGLAAVKNVGEVAIEQIIEVRERQGHFKDLYDFCERVDSRAVNRKVIESLIKCGAFDSLGTRRSVLMAILDEALELAQSLQRDRLQGQLSFFDQRQQPSIFKEKFRKIPEIREWPETQILAFEKELLGFYISGHPLAKYKEVLQTYSSCSCARLASLADGSEVLIGGLIARLKKTTTRRGNERMAILNLEDLEGEVEAIVFPDVYVRFETLIYVNNPVFIRGRVSQKEDKLRLMVIEIFPIEDAGKKFGPLKEKKILKGASKGVVLSIRAGLSTSHLEKLKQILITFPGRTPVYLDLWEEDGNRTRIELDNKFRVFPRKELFQELYKYLGEENVTVINVDKD